MAAPDSRKVVIRTPDKQYLCGDAKHLGFGSSVYEALLIDPERIPLEPLLAELRRASGLAVEAVVLDLDEVLETCDRCGQQVIPLIAWFDGKQFLCPDCAAGQRTGASAKSQSQ